MKKILSQKIPALFVLCLLLFTSCSGAAQSNGVLSASASTAQAGLDTGSVATSQSIPPEQMPMAASAGIYAPEFEVQAPAAYVVNEESGVVVYAKNPDMPLVAASLVKVMTCLVAMDMVQDLDAETVTAEVWVFNELYGKNASNADIWKGETLSVRELLYAMLLPSANEAALMLANHVASGYMPNFLYLMKEKAKELGCTGTVFADPNGLSDQNLTTARDMYLIMRAFMQNPVLVEIAQTTLYQMAAHNHPEPYNIMTTNRLLVPSDPYAKKFPSIFGLIQAGKTGILGEWQNFASMAHKDGETYYCVVLNSPNTADDVAVEQEASSFRPALCESARLYEWVFGTFGVRPALDTTKPITEVLVKYSTAQDSVKLMPAAPLKTVLPLVGDQKVELEFDLPDFVAAPVRQGQVVGTVTLKLQGQVLGTVNLIAAQDVERNTYKYILQRIGEAVGTTIFKVIALVIVLLVAGYIALLSYANHRYKKRKENSGGNPRQVVPSRQPAPYKKPHPPTKEPPANKKPPT